MLSSETPQGLYTPLSQAVTDSDSEEEIHKLTADGRHHCAPKYSNNSASNSITPISAKPDCLQWKIQQHQLNKKQFQHKKNQFSSQDYHDYKIRNKQETVNKIHQHPDLKQSVARPTSFSSPTQNSLHRSTMTDSASNRDLAHHGGNFSSFNSDCDEHINTDADNVAILGTNESKDSDSMSNPRKCCFIVSVLMCVLTVVGFLITPCSDAEVCPALADRLLTHNWLNNYTKIELKGMINVVNGLRSWEKNLLFLYRGDFIFSDFEQSNSKRNGIISLIGSSGAVAWYDETFEEPMAIDCTLLDVDNNGTPDCLVIDEYGELGAINPISGQWYWKFKEKSKHKIDALDFPVILPDLDGDNVLEILLATSAPQESSTNFLRRANDHRSIENIGLHPERNFLRILSGRIGKPIGGGFKIHDCDFLRKFQFEESHVITYNCVRNKTEVQRSKSLAEVFSLITNKSIGRKLTPAAKIAQHRHYGQRKETDIQRNIYSLSGRELIIENRGKCPDECSVSFFLSEMRNGKIHVLSNFSTPRMYGMVPTQWHFKNGKSTMSGFVLKFWMWNSNSTQDSSSLQLNQYSNYRKKRSQSIQFDVSQSAIDIFENMIQKSNSHTISVDTRRLGRSIVSTAKQKSNSRQLPNNYKLQTVTETVFLVVFNGADTRIENTSQSNIVQFCRNEHKEFLCQPDLNNQENSLLITDLDQDGSQELVSYYSTFINRGKNEQNDWHLVTFVQLLRLESELPNFYSIKKHT